MQTMNVETSRISKWTLRASTSSRNSWYAVGSSTPKVGPNGESRSVWKANATAMVRQTC